MKKEKKKEGERMKLTYIRFEMGEHEALGITSCST